MIMILLHNYFARETESGPDSSLGFWMLHGTPQIQGKPFIWSESIRSRQSSGDDPDR